MASSGLRHVRLHCRIISRMIGGQDCPGALEMDAHTEKIDYGLNIYWTACLLLDRNFHSEKATLWIII